MSNPNFKLKLPQLRKDLQGDYAGAAKHCNVSAVTISRLLNGVYVNEGIIIKIIEYRDIKAEQRLQKIKELNKRIDKKVA